MGIFAVECTRCKKPFQWFSGIPAQICEDCTKADTKRPREKVIVITPRFRAGNFCGYDQLEGNTFDNAGQRYEFVEKSAFDHAHAVATKLVNEQQDKIEALAAELAREKLANAQLAERVRELEAERDEWKRLYQEDHYSVAHVEALEKQVAELQRKIRIMEHAD